jgi:unsaturated rhamnogalacturonyl hydrolase
LVDAERGYKGILKEFVKADGEGFKLTGTVGATDLGGVPYKDGSYGFYTGVKTVTDDAKGLGAFMLASTEMENAKNARLGRGETVMMDAWFNSQMRADATGKQIYFHYKWDDQAASGYSLLGHIFENFGAELKTLYVAPTAENLRDAQVYIVASPDIPAKNPKPHYADAEDAREIAKWVHDGGVLLMMENDTSFADLDHFNLVSEKYGIHFNSILRKHVEGTNWAQGKIDVAAGGPVFHEAHTLYVKDVCTITATAPAKAILTEGGDVFMAVAHYGKGTVYAFVDPWLYNEYTDGRKLPATYDNYAGGVEFVRWALEQVSRGTAGAGAAPGDKSVKH